MIDAMTMFTALINGATWRKNGTEDKWVMTSIYPDGRVALTRERDGFTQKFAPHVIAEQFTRRV
jgi:hypothetical protein